METTINIFTDHINAVILKEHTSVWAFCSKLEDVGVYTEQRTIGERAVGMLVQGLRDWASYREQARREYESLMRQAQDKINDVDNNQTIFWELDSDRVKDYNAKAEAQVAITQTASYIIGLNNETLKQLFAIVTTLQFAKQEKEL